MIKINDNIEKIVVKVGEDEILFYVRKPKTSEKIDYQRKTFEFLSGEKSGEAFQKQLEYHIELGMKHITGFREGDIEYEGKIISSDEKSENYYPKWKEVIKEHLGEVVSKLIEEIYNVGKVEVKKVPFERN
jgi:hypothetical protein